VKIKIYDNGRGTILEEESYQWRTNRDKMGNEE
jgi:hypothetical protein